VGSDSADTGERASIHITRRTTHWADLLRAYRVYIDGQHVGDVRDGESAEFPVAPGLHEVFLRIDWGGSPRMWVQCAAGGVARLTCRGHANPFGAVFTALFAWDRYIHLVTSVDRASGDTGRDETGG